MLALLLFAFRLIPRFNILLSTWTQIVLTDLDLTGFQNLSGLRTTSRLPAEETMD